MFINSVAPKRMSIVALLSLLIVSGCQTISSIDQTSHDVMFAKAVTNAACIIIYENSPHLGSEKFDHSQLSVHSITDRHDGWQAADITDRGLRANTYFNRSTGEVICGSTHWKKYLDNTYKPRVYAFVNAGTASRNSTTPISHITRDIKGTWGGESNAIFGKFSSDQDGNKGDVYIRVLNMDQTCIGTYALKTPTSGSWSVRCQNRLGASGSISNSIAKGSDSQFRDIHFTIGDPVEK